MSCPARRDSRFRTSFCSGVMRIWSCDDLSAMDPPSHKDGLTSIHRYWRRLSKQNIQAPGIQFPAPTAFVGQDARFEGATSTAARRLDCGDVDLFHLHHRIERALGGGGIGIGYRLGQSDRRNLPAQSPFVLTPAARTLLAAVADDCVPVTIGFGLVGGCDLKRECFVVLGCGSAIEPEAGNPHHRKLDRQASLAGFGSRRRMDSLSKRILNGSASTLHNRVARACLPS